MIRGAAQEKQILLHANTTTSILLVWKAAHTVARPKKNAQRAAVINAQVTTNTKQLIKNPASKERDFLLPLF